MKLPCNVLRPLAKIFREKKQQQNNNNNINTPSKSFCIRLLFCVLSHSNRVNRSQQQQQHYWRVYIIDVLSTLYGINYYLSMSTKTLKPDERYEATNYSEMANN